MSQGKKLTYEFVKSKFIERGYTPKFTKYKNSHTKLDYICPNWHEHSITWGHFKNGKGCPSCAGKIKLIFEEIRVNFIQKGYTPKFTEYINAHTKLEYICPNGHEHSTTWANWQSGYRCPHCSGNARLTIDFIKPFFEKWVVC